MPIVRRMRGSAALPGHAFLDSLFCELLARGSTNAAADAQRLMAELNADAILEAAVTDEYLTAYAAALAYVHQTGKVDAPAARIWAAALPFQASEVRAFAWCLSLNAANPRPPTFQGRPKPSRALTLARAISVGILLNIDHDVTWGHVKEVDIVQRVSCVTGRSRSSVRALVRRHRGATGLGVQTHAARRGGRTWMTRIRRTLWFQRLKPLHPRIVTTQTLALPAVVENLREALASVASKERDARVPRKSLAVPSRAELEASIPDSDWSEFSRTVTGRTSRAGSAREAFLVILAVAKSNCTWDGARSLGLMTGQAALRRLRRWQSAGAGPAVEQLLLLCGVSVARVAALRFPGKPVKRRSRGGVGTAR